MAQDKVRISIYIMPTTLQTPMFDHLLELSHRDSEIDINFIIKVV